jgi:hypothetical protein
MLNGKYQIQAMFDSLQKIPKHYPTINASDSQFYITCYVEK